MSGLRIVSSDGSITSVTIQDSSSNVYRQVKYVPQTPDISVTEAMDVLTDGGEIPVASLRNITETVDLFVDGGTAAARIIVGAIEKLFQQARVYQRRRIGPRIYVEFKPVDSDTTWFRSEVLNGKFAPSDDTLGWQILDGKLMGTITWTRRFYWEDSVESYLQLSNGHTSNVSSGITVDNTNDSSRDNWVKILAAQVGGNLPAPCRIEMTNLWTSSPAGARLNTMYIGHCAINQPTPANLILEGESMTNLSGSSSVVAGGGYSNGNKLQVAWTGASTFNIGKWALSSALLGQTAGGYYRMVIACGDSPSGNFSVTPKVMVDLTTIWVGPTVRFVTALFTPELQDMFTVQLPPYLIDALGNTMYPLILTLTVSSTDAGSHTFPLDYAMLLPLESYRVLRQKGYGCDTGVKLIDDEMLGAIYTDGWPTAGRLGNYVGYGTKVQLVPNRDNYLYFIMDSDTAGNCDPAQSVSVRIAYRARRLTL